MYHYSQFVVRLAIFKSKVFLAKTVTILGGYDYIIVGQGLAGTALAWELHSRGARICVINDPDKNSSSRVAAGLYNPVTGRKMVKTWNADVLFPLLDSFYSRLEELCEARFLHKTPIYRPFLSIEEQNEWMGKSASAEFSAYVKEIRIKSVYSFTNDPLGGIVLDQAGYLDIPAYLNAMGAWLREKNSYRELKVDPNDIKVSDNQVTIGDLSANKLIFCDGTYSVGNRFFSWLPFRPVKGELIEIEMEAETTEIVNRGVFVLPLGENRFRVGSTYDNSDQEWTPTESGRLKITEQLRQLIKTPFRIHRHYAGVRPATADRRPIAGRHPEFETIITMNGLGTKGVSLAPYVAGELANYLIDDVDPAAEININRYFSLY